MFFLWAQDRLSSIMKSKNVQKTCEPYIFGGLSYYCIKFFLLFLYAHDTGLLSDTPSQPLTIKRYILLLPSFPSHMPSSVDCSLTTAPSLKTRAEDQVQLVRKLCHLFSWVHYSRWCTVYIILFENWRCSDPSIIISPNPVGEGMWWGGRVSNPAVFW